MDTPKNLNPPFTVHRKSDLAILSMKGSVLVYLIVVILIFGVLGVTMVSLFTSAIISSATPNDARRAFYIAESGVRYALSRIRNANFHQDLIEDINQTTAFTLDDGSSFTVNVFSPWFISTTGQINPGVNPFTLTVPNEGKIPEGFSIPDADVALVNWNTFRGTPPPSNSYADITDSTTTAEATSLTITLETSPDDDLQTSAGDTVCLAVQPTDSDILLQEGEDILIAAAAKDFFPSRHGAIRIVTSDNQVGEYYYQKLIDESTKIRLTNLAPMPGSGPFTQINNFGTNDWVVLSLYNYQVIATGKSDDVTVTLGLDKQIWAFPPTGDWTITEREFIEDASQKVSDIVNPVAKTELGPTEDEDKIILGGDDPGFGDLWYGGDETIGGNNNFCQGGKCLFQDGIRVFFTLDNSSGDGEGFIFTLIAAGDDGMGSPVNTKDSAGGDFESSELLGYAGDGRVNSTPQFLDGSGEGLKPPKIGAEFDTKTQFDQNFSLQRDYCSGANLVANTRNDPQPGGSNQDAVQYVFWGSDGNEDPPYNILKLSPCRDDSSNKASYDDNRHDAESFYVKWTYATGGEVKSSPAVGSDGTIYVGSDDGNVYAFNPEDRQRHYDFGDRSFPNPMADNEWQYPTDGNVRSSPLVVENGDETTIYIGSDDNSFYALDKDGNYRWDFNVGGDVSLGPPSIGPNGNIYVSNRETASGNLLYFLNSDSGAREWSFDIGDENEYMAGVDPNSGVIYSDRSGAELLALNQDGSQRWVLPAVDLTADVRSTPQVGTDGTVYFTTFYNFTAGFETGEFFAVSDDGSNGTILWRYPGNTGGIGSIDNVPALSNDESVVYAVTFDEKLYAINTADGSLKWWYSPIGVFPGPGEIQSSPTVDPDDDTIYVGSDEDPGGKILAVNPDKTLRWKFPTPMDINSTPAVDPNSKIVYAGSDDFNLYAVNQIAEPRSYRTEQEDKKVVAADDFAPLSFTDSNNWLQEGPWAVRIEVTRDTVVYPGVNDDEGVYVLKAWVEKCSDSSCSKPLSSLFRDTLVEYDVAGIPPKLVQTITLSEADHDKFERFLFGFTTAAASGDTQESIIKFFELSFIRSSSDPVVTSDPNMGG
ncbi:PQQ-binding-like beta-propeller repeat protein [bacterium]|nr:PQQ-binding-like beta-propeller repeat protein [bacterium]